MTPRLGGLITANHNLTDGTRKKKEEHQFKVAGVQLPLKIIRRTRTAWIDNESPISIFIFTNAGKSGSKIITFGAELRPIP